MANHKLLQKHVEGKHDEANLQRCQITPECRLAFDRIMKDDYSELSKIQTKILEAFERGLL